MALVRVEVHGRLGSPSCCWFSPSLSKLPMTPEQTVGMFIFFSKLLMVPKEEMLWKLLSYQPDDVVVVVVVSSVEQRELF